MPRAPCVALVLLLLLLLLACNDAPSSDADATPCTPLSDPAVTITSEALTPDGHYVVILGAGAGARVFYGVATHLVEGMITGTHAACAPEVDFEVEGRAYEATFPPSSKSCTLASGLVLGDPSTASSTQMPLAAAAASASSLMFYCK